MAGRMKRALPHLVMLLVSVLLYWAAMQIDTGASDGGRRIGPDFWPKTVIALMGLLCLYEVIKRLAARSDFTADGLTGDFLQGPGVAAAEEPAAATPASSGAAQPRREYTGRLVAGVVLIGAYGLGVDRLGFFVATALFLAGFMLIGGWRRPLLATAFGFMGSFGLIVIFMRVAYISLPLGTGPFRALSLALLRLLGVS